MARGAPVIAKVSIKPCGPAPKLKPRGMFGVSPAKARSWECRHGLDTGVPDTTTLIFVQIVTLIGRGRPTTLLIWMATAPIRPDRSWDRSRQFRQIPRPSAGRTPRSPVRG
jgi:hypothetical protein